MRRSQVAHKSGRVWSTERRNGSAQRNRGAHQVRYSRFPWVLGAFRVILIVGGIGFWLGAGSVVGQVAAPVAGATVVYPSYGFHSGCSSGCSSCSSSSRSSGASPGAATADPGWHGGHGRDAWVMAPAAAPAATVATPWAMAPLTAAALAAPAWAVGPARTSRRWRTRCSSAGTATRTGEAEPTDTSKTTPTSASPTRPTDPSI